MFGFKRRRRQRLRDRPLPSAWGAIIDRTVHYCRFLTVEEQRELDGHIQVFLHEKPFEGCGGLEITDEIRVTIAAHACILLLNRDTDYYPALRTILVYPHHYRVESTRPQPDGTVIEGLEVRSGESWHRGAVVLSWDDVRRDAANIHDGHNVVFHECAHQLDSESGANEGTPALTDQGMYATWTRVMNSEYQRLLDDLEEHRPTLIRAYAATSPAEFFAVITELFFERPAALKQHHTDLYTQLAGYYRQDPVTRFESPPPLAVT